MRRQLQYGRGCAGVAALVAGLVGCSAPQAYRGTASLERSGVPARWLASGSVSFTSCSIEERRGGGDQLNEDDLATTSFTVMSIGDGCRLIWLPQRGFVPDANLPCRLDFREGSTLLRVSDVNIRYGVTDRAFGRRLSTDPSYVEIDLGGDDVNGGRHALYRFAGHADAADDSTEETPLGATAGSTSADSKAQICRTASGLAMQSYRPGPHFGSASP